MHLFTSRGLAYPITVTKLIRQPGDEIDVNAPLFTYKYSALNTEYDEEKRENVEKERTYFSDFESEIEGTVVSLNVKVGQVIERVQAVADIDEPCRHEVQFGGLCANCGKDMTIQQYSTTTSNTNRAKINNVHGHTSLLVSEAEALRADEEAKRRLLESRKLSLVVDLDQTIIQACVEPTVAEWQKDPENPNYEAVKDVQAFQLVDDGPGARGTWYYIKTRPGVPEFLETMAKYYELHIYTMATRAYAENIAKIVDPDRKLFGDRILSRDENGSMSSKSLARLFPVDTKMVVIIDDRGDVWSWSPNLVKVPAYDFFVGVGDINSSFLPKRQQGLEARPSSTTAPEKPGADESANAAAPSAADDTEVSPTTVVPAPTNGDVSTLDRMISMANQDEGSLKEQANEQDQQIAEQMQDRPLLQKQKMLEAAEEEARTSPAAEAAVELLAENAEGENAHASKYRHNLLQDDDNELEAIGATLRRIHDLYYAEYDKDSTGSKGGRVSELRPGHRKKRSLDELQNIPDAPKIMEGIRSQVLAGVHLVFTGVVRLGLDIHAQDIAHWAKWYGATVSENITKRTTHVIASPDRRTAKVRKAAKRGDRISIVNQNWLYACLTHWRHVDEEPYRIHTEARTNGAGGLPDSVEGKEVLLSSSEEEAAQTEEEDENDESGTTTPNGFGKTQLVIDTDVEELEKYGPSMERKDSSPTETEQADDWADLNKELEDELGSDWDDSDTESVRSEASTAGDRTPRSARKRKREGESDDGDEVDDGSEEGSRLQKRKREALARTTSLTNVASTVSNGAGNDDAVEEDDNDSLEDDLEAALEAEMMKGSDDEADGGEEESKP